MCIRDSVTVTPFGQDEQCCGFGGTFSFKNPDVSGAMADAKLDNIRGSGASLCTGGDASCLMHLGGAASKRKVDVQTVHFAEILASTRSNPLHVEGPVELSIPQPGRRSASPATTAGATR